MYQPATAPLTIGETLDQGFRLFKASFPSAWLLAAVAGISALPMNLVAPETPEQFGQRFGLWIGTIFVYLLVSLLLFAALTLRIGGIARGTPIGLGASIRLAFRRSPMLLGTVLLYTVGCVIGFVLLFIPGIWFSVVFVFAIYATVLDGKDPIESFGYSWQIVVGKWLRTAVVLTVIVLIAGVVYGLLVLALGLLLLLGEFGQADTEGTIALIEFIVAPLLQILLVPLTYALIIAVYLDASLRHEGTDLAARIEAAA